MSTHSLNLAFKSDIKKSSLKFILVALADYANEDSEAYPSIQTIVKKTALDRKTVQSGLNELVSLGYMYDTGMRRGSTKGVKVWKLTIERSQKRDDLSDPKNGTASDPKNGITKRSQKRDTEPSDLLTTSLTKKTNKKDFVSEHIKTIFDFWCLNLNKSKTAKLTPKRKKCIEARLKEGYTVDNIKQAIIGCSKSAYHMGQNDGGMVYDDLTLICRSGDKLEAFMAMINNIPKPKAQEKFNAGAYLAEKQRLWREQNGH